MGLLLFSSWDQILNPHPHRHQNLLRHLHLDRHHHQNRHHHLDLNLILRLPLYFHLCQFYPPPGCQGIFVRQFLLFENRFPIVSSTCNRIIFKINFNQIFKSLKFVDSFQLLNFVVRSNNLTQFWIIGQDLKFA